MLFASLGGSGDAGVARNGTRKTPSAHAVERLGSTLVVNAGIGQNWLHATGNLIRVIGASSALELQYG